MSVTNAKDSNSATNTALALITAFILVALIVGVLGHSNGREQERRQTLAAELAELAKDEARRECVGADQASVVDCVHDRIVASQDQARADQDLDAQQGMKFWAAVMAVLTFLTVCVTALGVWFVKRTLDATLDAVEDTGLATSAMVEANTIAKQTSETELRPFMAFSGINDEVVWNEGGRKGWNILFNWENIGRSPAEVISVRQFREVIDSEIDFESQVDQFLEFEISQGDAVRIVPRDGAIEEILQFGQLYWGAQTQNEMEASGGALTDQMDEAFIVWSVIEYRNPIFGRERIFRSSAGYMWLLHPQNIVPDIPIEPHLQEMSVIHKLTYVT